jgi:hypothetical protein
MIYLIHCDNISGLLHPKSLAHSWRALLSVLCLISWSGFHIPYHVISHPLSMSACSNLSIHAMVLEHLFLSHSYTTFYISTHISIFPPYSHADADGRKGKGEGNRGA